VAAVVVEMESSCTQLLNEFGSSDIPKHIIEWSLDFLNMAINSLLKLVSNTTVVEAGTPQ